MIHHQASVHPNAKIASTASADPFCVIHDNTVIGEGSWIGSNAVIMPGARIGKNCKIFPGAVIAGDPQDIKFDGRESLVEIGDNTTIREFVTIHRGTQHRGKTTVGNHCLIMAYCHIAHDCIVEDNCIMSNNAHIAGHVTMGEFAVIGGMSAVHQFTRIGKHAFIAGGSLVFKDVPPYIKAGRNPLSYGGVNSIGLKRRGFSMEQINGILDIYRTIYNKGLNISQALDLIEEEYPVTDEKDEIVSFIRESNRGIIKKFIKNTADDDFGD